MERVALQSDDGVDKERSTSAEGIGQQTMPAAFDVTKSEVEEKNETRVTKTLLQENNMDSPEHQALYAKGYEMRKKVVGEEYVAGALEKGKSDFKRPLQQFATVCLPCVLPYPCHEGCDKLSLNDILQESAWGTIWTRPGLDLKTRSLLNLVMLTALSKWIELGTHVRGAIRNGATEVEIREALLQARFVASFLNTSIC